MPQKSQIRLACAHKAEIACLTLHPMAVRTPVAESSQSEASEPVT